MLKRLLLIDDDAALARMVGDYLRGAAFEVETAGTGLAGIEMISRAGLAGTPYDALVLDLMLPDLDGLEVCRRLRGSVDLPILMLTARGDETDRIVGLEVGADDYLPKPFNPRELLARLNAILRRGRAMPDGRMGARTLRFGRLEIDPGSRQVRIDGEARPMTSYQFDLLAALATHAGRVLSRDQILDLVKGEELEAFDRSIDVHISRIRQAIETDPRHPRRIITVRGAG